jgi:hypothetical protein
MRIILLTAAILFSVLCSAQAKPKKKTTTVVRDPKKYGYWKITTVEADEKIPMDAAQIKVTFQGPTDTPPKKGVRIVCNNDSVLPPLDATGSYSLEVDPGKYKMKFAAPYWYRIITDSIHCKKQTTTNIFVRFEPQDFSAH